MRSARRGRLVGAAVLLLASWGCGGIFCPDDCGDREIIRWPPPLTDPVLLFEFNYEQKQTLGYKRLFTQDFEFEFSTASDPDLAQEFAAGWTAVDERIAARNLFQGGTNRDGWFHPAASSIDLRILDRDLVSDTTGGRDPNLYRVLHSEITLRVVTPPLPGESAPREYRIGFDTPAVHRISFVRGDIAALDSLSQPARADRWYIWRWADESPPPAAAPVRAATSDSSRSMSWGRLKGVYR